MTGLLARIREQPPEVLDAIATSMNVRASEPAMKAICACYMARIALPERARVLEIGCGNGAATKLIMQHVNPAQLVGIDPSSAFIDMAMAQSPFYRDCALAGRGGEGADGPRREHGPPQRHPRPKGRYDTQDFGDDPAGSSMILLPLVPANVAIEQQAVNLHDPVDSLVIGQPARAMGITEVITAPRSPWQNPYAERLIRSIRRECLDHVIILSERHLRRVLSSYFQYHHDARTHLSLNKDCPRPRPAQLPCTGNNIIAFPEVGGLHHRYERRAA